MFEQLKSAWSTLEKEQQTSVVLLGVLGVIAFGLSAYRIRANIFEPFLVPKSTLVDAKNVVGDTPDQILARSKRTDTDGDGLSDWAEENVYRTNPNLRDSCGDGIPDNVRVITGKNIDCGNAVNYASALSGDAQASGTRKLSDLNVNGLVQYPTGGQAGPNDTAQALQSALPRDPVVIREMLKGKIDEAKLSQISDADLLSLYDQAIAIQAGQPADASQSQAAGSLLAPGSVSTSILMTTSTK